MVVARVGGLVLEAGFVVRDGSMLVVSKGVELADPLSSGGGLDNEKSGAPKLEVRL